MASNVISILPSHTDLTGKALTYPMKRPDAVPNTNFAMT